ncbi:Ribonuclease HII/HIII domain [Phytophthora cactorum]|nr:Ribonuclease HII/HIII domain [Phytophthora cactorum]
MRKTIKRAVKVAAPRRSPRLNKVLAQTETITTVSAVSVRAKRTPKPKKAVKNKKDLPSSTLSRGFETRYEAKGYTTVIGVDEAGRGPLAGPVVAAACHVPLDVTIPGVDDSKKLLTTHPSITYAVHVNSAQRIDEINILQASLESMTESVNEVAERLRQKDKTFVLVDGNKLPPTLELPAEAVVKGDSKVYSIAAASIIAKVTRDRLMREYDEKFPQYGLAKHKGYPTRDHVAAIAKHGPCEIHRMTFAPLKPKEAPKPKVKGKKKST